MSYICSMKADISHRNKSGIYCIRNTVNNKVYIGKAKCIHNRIKRHIGFLNASSVKHENQHLINSWNKYGRSQFDYYVLEFADLKLLAERELYWMKVYDSTNREKGYNFRLDSSTGMVTHPETRMKLSKAQKKRYSNPEERKKTSKRSKKFWANNPDVKAQMAHNVSKNRTKYNILQFDKEMNLVQKWDSVKKIVENNPDYKWQNIYAVCNGYKPTYMGYVWKKELKI